MDNLEKCGVLKKKESRWVDAPTSSSWSLLSERLDLTKERVDTEHPRDIAYVTSGYAPLSARLVELVGRVGGWSQLGETFATIPGPAFKFTVPDNLQSIEQAHQLFNPPSMPSATSIEEKKHSSQPISRSKQTKPVLFVFVVGGLSYDEISALRLLSNDASFPYTLLIGTTKLVNGNSFLKSVVHDLGSK